MPLHFTVLASGSGGNASLLESGGFGVLLDAGLGPRKIAQRLRASGASWDRIHAVLLTHTHVDHWKDTTFAHLSRRKIPLYCHAEHHQQLTAYGRYFAVLQLAGLVRGYESDAEFVLAPGLRCRPLTLRHDGGATFGFRFDAAGAEKGTDPLSSRGQSPFLALGYVADLGSWNDELAEQLADVDLLAVEFNHDVELESSSGRSPDLIARVLGEEGHLSNHQAVALLQEVLRRSTKGRVQHLVQLHLSRECNRPRLAAESARQVLIDVATEIAVYTASQDHPLPTIIVGATRNGARPSSEPGSRRRPAMRSRPLDRDQRCFPVMEE